MDVREVRDALRALVDNREEMANLVFHADSIGNDMVGRLLPHPLG